MTTHDLKNLNWKMVGTYPYENQLNVSLELGTIMKGEMDPVEVTIPCSVQKSLLNHGLCPDWNHGMNFRSCEWVENRFWIFATDIPADWLDPSSHQTLHFEGLDFNGEIYFQGQKTRYFSHSLLHGKMAPVRMVPLREPKPGFRFPHAYVRPGGRYA